MIRLSIFVAIGALVVGMVGCGGGDGNNGGDSYTLIVDFTDGGTVAVDDLPIPGRAILTYDPGTVVSLNATPSAGYRFVNWTGNATTIDDVNAASTTVTMNSDYDVSASFEEIGVFADPNLEAAVREAIGIPTGLVYPSDLEGLTDLAAGNKDIADLTGLEYCTSLTGLALSSNRIGDISSLAGLTNLTDLILSSNQISDISPLADLTGLTHLDLSSNQISDISPLAGLTSLIGLTLSSNQIGDISSLADLTSLAVLILPSNQISDISSLADLTSLTWLSLYQNQINDISPLASLTGLEYLHLGRNQISDISPLVDNEGLSEGDKVYLMSNALSSASINIYMPQLRARGVSVYY